MLIKRRSKTSIDTSHELHLYRTGNGIRLIKPEQITKENQYSTLEMKHTVGSIMNLPFTVFFLNGRSQLENANQVNIEILGLESLKEGIGKSVFDHFPNEVSRILMKNDSTVIDMNRICFFDEEALVKEDVLLSGLSIKLPLYDYHNKIIGILGYTIVTNSHPLAESLSTLTQLGFLNNAKEIFTPLPGLHIGDAYLTKRKIAILQQIIKGHSARAIGEMLCISQRTVETHIHHIKHTLNVRTKAEMIEKVLNQASFKS